MSAPGFAVRDYRPEDEDAVLALLRQTLGDGRAFDRTGAFWKWKHFWNPFGQSLLMLAVNSKEPLGLRAFMRWQFTTGDRIVTAVRAVDTATHPASRRSGVFATLTGLAVERAQREGIDLIFNTPNQFSLPGYLKLGWRFVGRPHLLVRVLRPGRIARVVLGRADHEIAEPVVTTPPAVPAAAFLAEAQPLERLLAENDRLCRNRIRTARSIAFLSWRYASAQTLAYYACHRGSNTGTAAAIFRLSRRRGLREILLAELLLGESAGRAVPQLIRDISQSVEADYVVAHAPRGSAHWWALVRAGFVPVPRIGPFFTVRALSAAAEAIAPAQPARWHLSLGDLEVF